MIEINFVAYLAISLPRRDHERFHPPLYSVLDSLLDLSGRLQCKLLDKEVPLQFALLGPSRFDSRLSKSFGRGFRKQYEVLGCQVQTEFDRRGLTYDDEEEFDNFVTMLCKEECLKRLFDVVGLANLASPGCLQVNHAVLAFEDRLEEIDVIVDADLLREAVLQTDRRGWPTIQQLDYERVWTWAQRFDGFLYGLTDSRTSRGLTALMNILHGRAVDPVVQLLWAMVGVEALFSRGRESVGQGLREACRLTLSGAGPVPNKLFNSAYGFRSAFVHGRQDFLGPYLLNDGRPEVDKPIADLLETTEFMVSILVAALQELVTRDWTEYRFRELVEDCPPGK
jgi:hypothetical protein